MADIVRRSDFPMIEMDPFRMMRELMRFDPFRVPQPLQLLERDVWMPQFEVRENGNSLRILADVPGVKRENLELTVNANRLIVSGHREQEQRGKEENVHTYERQYGQFMRSFTLPDQVDLDHITSELRDGVLTIVVPLKAGSQSRKIQIGGTAPKS